MCLDGRQAWCARSCACGRRPQKHRLLVRYRDGRYVRAWLGACAAQGVVPRSFRGWWSPAVRACVVQANGRETRKRMTRGVSRRRAYQGKKKGWLAGNAEGWREEAYDGRGRSAETSSGSETTRQSARHPGAQSENKGAPPREGGGCWWRLLLSCKGLSASYGGRGAELIAEAGVATAAGAQPSIRSVVRASQRQRQQRERRRRRRE